MLYVVDTETVYESLRSYGYGTDGHNGNIGNMGITEREGGGEEGAVDCIKRILIICLFENEETYESEREKNGFKCKFTDGCAQ